MLRARAASAAEPHACGHNSRMTWHVDAPVLSVSARRVEQDASPMAAHIFDKQRAAYDITCDWTTLLRMYEHAVAPSFSSR